MVALTSRATLNLEGEEPETVDPDSIEADLTDALQRKITIYPLWRAPQ